MQEKITLLYPAPREKIWVSNTWDQHLARPGYSRAYAGTDFAGPEQPLRPSQFSGKVLQSMWSTQGYGYTTFVEHVDKQGRPLVRIRNAHQKTLDVVKDDIVNPSDTIGIMDSTGNSTGTHTHWEVWINYIDKGWLNIDPFDQSNGISVVNDPSLLVPLGDIVPPEYEPVFTPIDPTYPPVPIKTTKTVTLWVNVRTLPKQAGSKISQINPGQTWYAYDVELDVLGNYWYLVRKDNTVGWAAAYWSGTPYLEKIE